jgi:hypothetical protein
MSLAELFNTTQEGLSPFSGEVDTKLGYVKERVLTSGTPQQVATAARFVGVVGSHVNTVATTTAGTLNYTDVIPEGILRASASGSSSLGDLKFNMSLLVNDQSNALEILPRPSENSNVRIHDLNIALNTETMGSLTWGYQPNLFGGFAEKCDVMPGLGTVASPHKPQFKYTPPSFGGVEVEVALSQQNHALDGGVTLAGAVGVLNSTVSTRLGTEARIAYDLGSMGGYGVNAKIGAEILSQKAVKFGGANSITQVDVVSDKLSGLGYFFDGEFSGAKVCLNKSKTKGLGPNYQTLGGYVTNAADAADTGRRHYDHLNATVKYTVPMAIPVDLSINYGITERKGVEITSTIEEATPMENKRLGLSLCSNVSDALCFSGSYDKIDSKVGSQSAKTDGGSAKAYAFTGRYTFGK